MRADLSWREACRRGRLQRTHERILVIEDESMSRTVIQTVLEESGFEVRHAEDGVEGMEALDTFNPDLVLVDLVTPRMHGYEVIRRLRTDDRTLRTPIVVLSAKAYPTDQRKALDMGADAFLSKPVRRDALVRLVRDKLDSVRVRFWGVRGSIATPGPDTVRYGGNTPCVTVERGRDLLILDAGTGLRRLGLALHAEARGEPRDIRMLITHTHWDHIQGFPFFVPAFVPGNRVDVHGPPSLDRPLEKVLHGQMDPQYFPVALGEVAADVSVHEIRERELDIGPFHVRATYVNHPGVTMAYRIAIGDSVVTYATDTEPYRALLTSDAEDAARGEAGSYGRQRDAALVEFLRGSDVYIADSQYTPLDYETKRGWGHTCYVDAVDLAVEAGVGQMVLFSHDPMHDDETLDHKLAHSRQLAREGSRDLEVVPAVEGAWIELSPKK
ncbi:MAG: response regulator [Myxococcota bacterium]